MTKDFKLSGVYKITNKVNGKFYIGSGNSVFSRWLNHASDLSNDNHINYKLQRAFDKYGFENFSFEIIEIHPAEGLNKREQYYLDTLCKAQEYIKKESLFFNKNTYNIKPLVDGVTGLPMKEEAIVRALRTRGFDVIYKVSNQGEFICEYDTQKQAAEYNNISRNVVSKSIKSKICPKNKNYYFTYQKDYDPKFKPNNYKVWNKGLKGKVQGNNNIPIYAYDIYGRFYKKFRSGVDAAKYFKMDNSSINRMIGKEKKKVLHSFGVHLYNLFHEEKELEQKLNKFYTQEENGETEVFIRLS